MNKFFYTVKMSVLLAMGCVLGIFFLLLRMLKIVIVKNPERLPRNQGNLIMISNHPAMPETVFLPLLFFREYLFHPIKLSPWSVPDKKNYYDKPFWYFLRLRSVPVDRGNLGSERKSLLDMKKILDDQGILVLFPEGGRTEASESPGEKKYLISKQGKKIREFKRGVGILTLKTNANIVPVWIEGTDKIIPNQKYFTFKSILNMNLKEKIYIKIGKPFRYPEELKKIHRAEEATKFIEQKMLELADEN